jgi:D-3-phosphoglycerate dehydrogenase/C-terminal binding protein
MGLRLLLVNFLHGDEVIERETAKRRGVHVDILRANGPIASVIPRELAAQADGLISFSAMCKIELPLDAFPRVRAVLRSGVGYDTIDTEAWGKIGVPAFNVPDYGTSEVADHAIALMLALTRGTVAYHDAMRSDPVKNWIYTVAPTVRRLRGAVFGVIGLGRIGLAAARRAQGFGMDVVFYDPYQPNGFEIATGLKRVRKLDDLMAVADIVSAHTPLSKETTGLVGAASLAKAKNGVIVINTARGPVVDLDALYDGLKSGKVAAAGLDVLPKEPPDTNHKLIRAFLDGEAWLRGRFTLSPHAAFYSPDANIDLRTKTLETVVDHLETGTLANCVNLEHLKRPLRQIS